MSIWYSGTTGGFYRTDIHTSYFTGSPGSETPVAPIADAMQITQLVYDQMLDGQSATQEITADGGGNPILTARAKSDATKWAEIRAERNGLLTACDYTHTSDWPGTNQAAWATYRQDLRDIPQTYSADPDTVVWPTPPV